MDNLQLSETLERVGDLLAAQEASSFRVRAYRRAAQSLRELDRPAAVILAQAGPAGLEQLPHVGTNIAHAIAELIDTGRLRMLERLEGELCPERLFASIPGIGPGLAHRIHTALELDTLEELELAAHDGRLLAMRGMGPRRVAAIRELLAARLRRKRRESSGHAVLALALAPSAADLLAIDGRYREQAARGALPKIAPRRFNPEHEAWLPIMHVDSGPFHVTALFSNTALAHRLRTTNDWVVIFYEGPDGDGQCTVVTERKPGWLAGLRVVRGREAECETFYAAARPNLAPASAQVRCI
jgi:hypothetical protein